MKRQSFYGCSNLTDVEFAEGSTCKLIGGYAFQNCTNLNYILCETSDVDNLAKVTVELILVFIFYKLVDMIVLILVQVLLWEMIQFILEYQVVITGLELVMLLMDTSIINVSQQLLNNKKLSEIPDNFFDNSTY